MHSRVAKKFLIAFFSLGYLVQACVSFLWYSPISKTQTLEDCLLMKENRSPFYPSYCDRLLKKFNIGQPATTQLPPERALDICQARTVGWGWSSWNEWSEGSCPEVCGRRCRSRTRSCSGPYDRACKDKGRAYELEDCPALEDEGDNGEDPIFTRNTSFNFQENGEENRDNDFMRSRDFADGANRRPGLRRQRLRRRRPRRNRGGRRREEDVEVFV